MSELEKKLVASYAKALQNFSEEAKAELIRLLSTPSPESEDFNEENFYSSFGEWSSEKSSEEVIAEIRSARRFRDKDLSF